LVEQRTENPRVISSILIGGIRGQPRLAPFLFSRGGGGEVGLRIGIVGIGRLDEAAAGLVEELRRLLRPYASVDVTFLRPPARQDGRPQTLAAEGDALRRALPAGARVVGLSQEGRAMDSAAFARWLGILRLEARPVAFVVGGAYGLDDGLKRSCSLLVSLSPLTMAHRIATIVLLEQLYRGFTILAGHPYHK
jgi:23S rRNA (pseudouridine1915-N3)-methyltransferase